MHRKLVALLAIMATPALAQEPVGCDKFKWPVDRERALLASAKLVAGGAEITGGAVKLTLSPMTEAKLPMEPSRKPRPGSYAGFVGYAAPPQPGTYRVTLSEAGWIDVLQGGGEVKSGAFSGVTGCAGIRKSVKFDLGASPFVVEISGVPAREIAIAVTPD